MAQYREIVDAIEEILTSRNVQGPLKQMLNTPRDWYRPLLSVTHTTRRLNYQKINAICFENRQLFSRKYFS